MGEPEARVRARDGPRRARSRRYAIDGSLTREELGWEPRYTNFSEGLAIPLRGTPSTASGGEPASPPPSRDPEGWTVNAQDLTVHTTAIEAAAVDVPVHGTTAAGSRRTGSAPRPWPRACRILVRAAQHLLQRPPRPRGIHAEPWDKYVLGGHRAGSARGWTCARGRASAPWSRTRSPRAPGRAARRGQRVPGAPRRRPPTPTWSRTTGARTTTAEYSFVNLGDPRLGIEWPVPLAQAELSENTARTPRQTNVAPLAPAPVLVLGARGQVGLALTELLAARALPFTGTRSTQPRGPGLLARRDQLGDALRGYRAVVNAAAFTAVDAAEAPGGRGGGVGRQRHGCGALAAACARAGTTRCTSPTDYASTAPCSPGLAYAPEDPRRRRPCTGSPRRRGILLCGPVRGTT
ncbi:sugar nucleotide-binding protein [Kocuria rhizophila]|nr:sugar nucleotide-binding protein [Kocuria rhizophila]